MTSMKTLLFILLAFLSIVKAAVISPSGSTVWTNGQTVQIQWSSLPPPELTIVLTRTGTKYHHTIVSYTPNSGSGTFTWQVQIPPQDGWPSSTASDLVYEVDFYLNGGWNNGGQLVARSQQFAIQWTGSGSPVPSTVTEINGSLLTIVTIIDPTTPNAAGWATTVQTEVIVGITTFTTVVTSVYPIGTPAGSTAPVVGLTTPPGVVTITVTNSQQLQTITQTTITGATTIGLITTTQRAQLQVNSGSRKFMMPFMINFVGALLGMFIFG
jgi:hypothetical protein